MASKMLASGMENTEKGGNISLLDLPEATLDCILKCLSPTELCTVSEVCTSLRDRCGSDHLWEKHIKHKWGRVIGEVAYKEWQCHVRKAKEGNLSSDCMTNQNGSLGSFSGTWPNLYLGSYLEDCWHLNGQLSNKFMMSLYFSLESGRFWFPAQFYKGLTIYNALFSYDSKSDTFQARATAANLVTRTLEWVLNCGCSSRLGCGKLTKNAADMATIAATMRQQNGGWRFQGKHIRWDMLRAPPVETPPYALHISDCLDTLQPGDQVEIQRRGITETHYGWRYAVIGHLESCNENENYCQCQCNEKLVVEFKQYPESSYMRRVLLNRKRSVEQGNRGAGYYGGIRKLHKEEDIEMWKKRFTAQAQMPFPLPLGFMHFP